VGAIGSPVGFFYLVSSRALGLERFRIDRAIARFEFVCREFVCRDLVGRAGCILGDEATKPLLKRLLVLLEE
jgi:hypothetical protein